MNGYVQCSPNNLASHTPQNNSSKIRTLFTTMRDREHQHKCSTDSENGCDWCFWYIPSWTSKWMAQDCLDDFRFPMMRWFLIKVYGFIIYLCVVGEKKMPKIFQVLYYLPDALHSSVTVLPFLAATCPLVGIALNVGGTKYNWIIDWYAYFLIKI